MNAKEMIEDIKMKCSEMYSKTFFVRNFVRTDVFPLFEATRHPEFNKFLLWPQPESVNTLLPQVKLLELQDRRNEMFIFSLCDKKDGRWLGVVKGTPYRDGIDLSFWLTEEMWGLRSFHVFYFIEDFIFLETKFDNIYIRMHTENKKVVRAVSAFKFKEIGRETLKTVYNEDLDVFVFHKNKNQKDKVYDNMFKLE